ncbi:spore protease YyaC [Ectobacillus panaciterrae]|uniref:spore protease YyaC n=1 Tax=Ectobacillus panaciterrae TaxID=363872 RepID=UPI0004200E02|nr:spore protease YyaC [Ectobacillus panaciterrae]
MNRGSFNLKYPFFEKEPQPMFYHEEAVCDRLSHTLYAYLPEESVQPLVLVCIGTDRSTGDALGPLVGSKLCEKGIRNFRLYGTLDEPVHALNLEETLSNIQQTHERPFIVAIDACLGKSQSVGSISVGKGPSKPGAAMNKKLPAVGDMHIHGIVNIHGFMEFFVLQNTRLNLVMKMADVIANGIQKTDLALSIHKKINHLS